MEIQLCASESQLILLELRIFAKNYSAKDKSATHNILRIQSNDFLMCFFH